MATIKVNGESQVVELPLTVEELIKQNNVENPELVSVQVNEEFLDRNEYAKRQVEEGDEIDFLFFMGGGQAYV
ncbi:MAG: sulfur carrier protein ThiS [Prevotella sp.]|nr:sulfur carrier protein ThiS [Prevotella sp.]